MRHQKTREELADSFFIRESEIARLFQFGRAMARGTFGKAQEIDRAELKHDYLDPYLVRLSSVLEVLGISDAELRRKVLK